MATQPNTTSTAPANTNPVAPAVPANTTSTVAAPANGSNSGNAILTNDQIDKLGVSIGEKLANAISYGDKAEKAKDGAITYREEAAQDLYPALDTILNLTPESRGKFDANAAKANFPQYDALRIAVCTELSKRLKDAVAVPAPAKDGTPKPPKFTGRVSKAFSRLVSSYKSGGDGGQTEADKAAREAEKERKVTYKDMATTLADIIKAYEANDQEALNVQVKAAVTRWPTKTHGKIFPVKASK